MAVDLNVNKVLVSFLRKPIVYFGTLLIVVVLVMSNSIIIKSNHVQIGKPSNINVDRLIAERRIQYINRFYDKQVSVFLRRSENYPEWQVKYIVECCKCEAIARIYNNNISTNNDYLMNWANAQLNIIRANSGDDYIWSDEFARYINTQTAIVCSELVAIHSEYIKHD